MLCDDCLRKMKCADTRPVKDGTRRRYVCTYCGNKITTIELPQTKIKSLKEQLKQLRKLREMAEIIVLGKAGVKRSG